MCAIRGAAGHGYPGLRLKATDAIALLEAEVLARFDIEDLPPGQRHAFLTECGREGVPGGRLYDAHIAPP